MEFNFFTIPLFLFIELCHQVIINRSNGVNKITFLPKYKKNNIVLDFLNGNDHHTEDKRQLIE